MHTCNRSLTLGLGIESGYSLLYFHNDYLSAQMSSAPPTPKARNFELPGDRAQYAPDRPADVTHVRLDIALDFEQETVKEAMT